jgi:hypothetical protein
LCGLCVVKTKGKVLVLADDALQVATFSRNAMVRQRTFQVSQNGMFRTHGWTDGVREFERLLDQPLLTGYVMSAA